MQNLVRLLILVASLGMYFPLAAQIVNPLGAAINSEFNEIHPLISANGQTLYFVRANHPSNGMGKEGSNDVWYAEKRGSQWTMSRRMPAAINKDRYNDLFSISPDEQTALIRGVYDKGKRLDEIGISITTKGRNGWSQPQKVDIPKLDAMVKGPYLSAYLGHDGKTLLLSFSESKTGPEDLYVCLQDRKGQWSKPIFLGKDINSSAGETTPFLASDQMTLYFASNRPGGQGGYDIWMSRRRDRTWQKWTKPVNLGEKINSTEDDLYFSIAADGITGYLSTRNKTVGKGDIVLIQFPQPEVTPPTLAQVGAVQGGSSQGNNSTALNPNELIGRDSTGLYAANTSQNRNDPNANGGRGSSTAVTGNPSNNQNNDASTARSGAAGNNPNGAGNRNDGSSTGRGGAAGNNPNGAGNRNDGSSTGRGGAAGNNPNGAGNRNDGSSTGRGGAAGNNPNGAGNRNDGSSTGRGGAAGNNPNGAGNRNDGSSTGRGAVATDLFGGNTPAPAILYSGKVIQDKTGQPLDAKIIYESLDDDGTSGVVSTNPATGEYKILLPVGKTYSIRAEAKDFVSASQRLDLTQINRYTEIKAVPITAVQLVSGANFTLENIFFEFAKATLQPESTVELNRIADLLLDNPTMVVEIQGHTDNIGTSEVNNKLSQERADAVRAYLLGKKVPADRITSKGYGFDRPIASNETPEGQAKNRRVDFVVIRR